MSWTVYLLAEAEEELRRLSKTERNAVLNALEKLRAMGPRLGYPHTSSILVGDRLRELRPRAGRSPWRVLYRQFGDAFVVGAVGVEAQVDRQDFTRSVIAAGKRLDEVEDDR